MVDACAVAAKQLYYRQLARRNTPLASMPRQLAHVPPAWLIARRHHGL
jgi:hypothetical protein